MVRLIPRETKFIDAFAEMTNNLTEGAKLLREILLSQRFDRVLYRDDQSPESGIYGEAADAVAQTLEEDRQSKNADQ